MSSAGSVSRKTGKPVSLAFRNRLRELAARPVSGPPKRVGDRATLTDVKRGKAERVVNAALWAARARDRGLSLHEVMTIPRYDDDASATAREKRWDRDKQALATFGVKIEWLKPDQSYTQEGYVLRAEAPPIPDGPVTQMWERWLHIIWLAEQGTYNLTVPRLAEYLGVDEDTILADLSALTCCCAGHEPHNYLDVDVSPDGAVGITGPRIYS